MDQCSGYLYLAATGMMLFGSACTGDEVPLTDDGIIIQEIASECRAGEVVRVIGNGPIEFGGIGALAVSADGTVYVADRMSQLVLAIFPDDRSVVLASRGEGPGEVMSPTALMLRQDRLVVLDLAASRWFSLNVETQEVLETGRFNPLSEVGWRAQIGMTEDGAWLRLLQRTPERLPSIVPSRIDAEALMVRLRAGASQWDTLFDMKGDEAAIVEDQDGELSLTTAPAPRYVRWSPARGEEGVWIPDSDLPGLHLRSFQGDTIRSVQVGPLQPKPYDPTPDSILVERLGRSTFNAIRPDHEPTVMRVVVASEGDVWAHLNIRSPEGLGRDFWQVFTPAGRTRFGSFLPEGAVPMAIRGDTLWLTATLSDISGPVVMRYELKEELMLCPRP